MPSSSGSARDGAGWKAWLERVGDRLNPILVKETRQAIKSSQFTFTFALVLIAVWMVTFVVVEPAWAGNLLCGQRSGLLLVVLLILSFPFAGGRAVRGVSLAGG